jgi:hypothetical protein
MGQFVSITDKPVRVTSASDAQELRIAPEVLEFDELDLTLHILSAEGTSPSVTIAIETGNQNDSTNGWNQVSAFAAKTASNTQELKNFKNFQRFVRWKVTALTGTSPAFTFTIQGVGRRWA